MHSWRFIPRCASACVAVTLVASGFVLSGVNEGQRPLASIAGDVAPAPDSTQAAPKPQATVPPKVKVTSQQTVVPAIAKAPVQPGKRALVAELPDTTTKNFGMVGVTWSAATKETDVTVEIRTRTEGKWSAWQQLDLDDMSAGGRPGTEPIWVGRADGVAAKVRTASGKTPADIKVMTIDPGKASSDGKLTAAATTSSTAPAVYNPTGLLDGTVHASTTAASALPPQPTIILRAAWGARKPTPCDSPRTVDQTKGAVLHHTAGSNTYTKDQSAAIVRGDQAYHMDGHGWCDLGYNFIVDKYGQIFEGRSGGITNQVRAAHSGNNEVNTYAMGVSMAGNYSTVEPSAALKDSVVSLIAWRFGQKGVAAKGTWHVGEKLAGTYGRIDTHTLNNISGHRNVVGTECPGQKGYNWISVKGGLRDRVESELSNVALDPAPANLASTGVTRDSISLAWHAVTGAPQYRIRLSTSSTMAGSTYYQFVPATGTITGLKADTTYYAMVRVIGLDGVNVSAYSSPAVKIKTAPAVLPTPAHLKSTGVTNDSISLSWDAVTGAPQYRVRLSTSSTMAGSTYYQFVPASGTITGLKANTTYYAMVRAIALHDFNLSPYTTTAVQIKTSAASTGTGTTVKESYTVPTSRSLAFEGHGYGHGIGMGQYGAQGAAKQGLKYPAILDHYYPGTDLSTKTGKIRVLLTKDTSDSVMVVGGSGLVFRNLDTNKTIKLPTSIGGKSVLRWTITPVSGKPTQSALQYRTGSSYVTYNGTTWTGEGQFEGPSGIALVLPDSSQVKFRGALRSGLPKSGATNRSTVNVLSIEDYVRGVVAAEMPSSWMPEALKAQSVAARTYGVRSLTSSRYYDICDTTACQVYGGAARETSATDSAISATASKILTYKGAPAFTQFSSSSGGFAAAGSQPYLKAVSDSYDNFSGNANHLWKATVSASKIEKAYASIGTLKQLKVTKRTGDGDWHGRVTTLSLVGSKKTLDISGNDARFAFGLKSNWFRLVN